MHKPLLALALAVSLSGCAYTHAKPDGTVRAAALGQATATHCPADEEADCTIAAGGSLSDGLVSILKDLVRIPFRLIAGAAGAVQ